MSRANSKEAVALRVAAKEFWIDRTLTTPSSGDAIYQGHLVESSNDRAGIARWRKLEKAADRFAAANNSVVEALAEALEFYVVICGNVAAGRVRENSLLAYEQAKKALALVKRLPKEPPLGIRTDLLKSMTLAEFGATARKKDR